ncbi:MAG TPA: carbon storage regulator [Phycisphaerales bacterium]|nr:carbon storage regulator [Phycisphaerales bacterium]
MLVLSRNVEEGVIITTAAGEEIRVKVVKIGIGQIKLGFEANRDVKIMRAELCERPTLNNQR